MPVRLSVTIDDPPAAPPNYTLCAFEVRAVTVGGELEPVAIYPGTTAGFEEAANVLVQVIGSVVKDVGVGLRLAAVAWWSEKPVDYCEGGRERMVSVYDGSRLEGSGWGQWKPEARLEGRQTESSAKLRLVKRQQASSTRG